MNGALMKSMMVLGTVAVAGLMAMTGCKGSSEASQVKFAAGFGAGGDDSEKLTLDDGHPMAHASFDLLAGPTEPTGDGKGVFVELTVSTAWTEKPGVERPAQVAVLLGQTGEGDTPKENKLLKVGESAKMKIAGMHSSPCATEECTYPATVSFTRMGATDGSVEVTWSVAAGVN